MNTVLAGLAGACLIQSAAAQLEAEVRNGAPDTPLSAAESSGLLRIANATAIPPAATDDSLEFHPSAGEVEVLIRGQPIAVYVYQDDQILRPYFSQLKLPSGIQVTRNHPPVEGTDLADHATMHPGLWLGFGDISGADFWRNKARVEQVELAEKPATSKPGRSLAVRNRYHAGERVLGEQSCLYTFRGMKNGWLLTLDTTFRPSDADVYFGSQEEMGLGVRVATPLAVRNGGGMIDSEGRKNEKQIWGNVARWVDYHGVIRGAKAGVLLMPHPENSRPCWFHARDYGLVVANPFERPGKAAAVPGRFQVKRGEDFRLRFGVYLHEGDFDPNEAYETYVKSGG